MLKIVSPMYNISRCHAIGSDVEPQRSAKSFLLSLSNRALIADATIGKLLHIAQSRIASKAKESYMTVSNIDKGHSITTWTR